jgi:putative membrane protein
MWGFGWGFMFLGPLFIILLAVALYFIITSSLRRSTHTHYSHHYPSRERAIEVLNERYAKGEISKEQFEQMKKDILG